MSSVYFGSSYGRVALLFNCHFCFLKFLSVLNCLLIMAESNPSKGKKLKMSPKKPSPVKQAFKDSLNASSDFTGMKKISELTTESAR